MIPIKLTIEGLYSYQTRQCIDFAELTNAGLFGIFGAVGSGKSSILEAITFALYGETERMNKGDNRNYNMMNLRSNRSFIEFEFINFENKNYKIMRSYKRNSKKYEDVKIADSILYLWENNDWIPQESINVDDVVGLSYNNFKRTIIIPQGQFKEFLELGAKDRTQMMKEIFNLHQYDLQDKANALYSTTKSHLENLKGQLQTYEEIHPEEIEILKEDFNKNVADLTKLETKLKSAEEQLNLLKNLKADFETLHQKQAIFAQLQKELPTKNALEKQVEEYERINTAFAALLSTQANTANHLHLKQQEAIEETQTLNQLQEKEKQLQLEIQHLQTHYEALPQKRMEETDLALWIQIVSLQKEITTIQERLQKGNEFVEATEKNVLSFKNKQQTIQEKIEQLKSKKPNATLLLEIEKWFGQKESLNKKLIDQRSNFNELSQEIETYNLKFLQQNLNKETYTEYFSTQTSNIEQIIEKLRQKAANIHVQEQLAHYAHTLQEGDACPLCGALEHPNIVVIDDLNQESANIKTAIKAQELALKNLQNHKNETENTLLLLNKAMQQQVALEKDLKETQSHVEAHLNAFQWKGFDAENREAFELQKQNLQTIDAHILQEETALKNCTKELEKAIEDLDKYKKAVEELRLEHAKKETQIEQNHNNLNVLLSEEYQNKSLENLHVLAQQLHQNNTILEQNYLRIKEAINEINPKIAAQHSKATSIQERIKELQNEAEQHNQQLNALLQTHKLVDIFAVKAILEKHLNITSIRQELESFKVQFKSLANSIEELEQKLAGKNFEPEQFNLQEQNVAILKTERDSFKDKTAQLRAEITRQENELHKKKTLIAVYEQTEKRYQNLKTMLNLFKAAGFVQYISSIYLRQLCDNANLRFHRLTRNQLSLQLNENNDFEVIDYLNEGKTRSVKTLSGGQSFQVSLSLALALAESVQSNAKANKNFFFIDEGFGTQDAQSINIVFETLMNLKKENRIVGIISHVDELKERIPISLSIVKDTEKGSLISLNN